MKSFSKTLHIIPVLALIFFTGVVSGDSQKGDGSTTSKQPGNEWIKKGWSSGDWTKDQITAFLTSLTQSDLPIGLGDYTFFYPEKNSELELISTVDYSGRGFFNSIIIVRRLAKQFAFQTIEGWQVKSLENVIQDISGNQRMELLVSTALTPYLGVTPTATWTAIYVSENGRYLDRSSSFKAYYKASLIPPLRQNLDNLKSTKPGSIQLAIAQIELDKTLRVSGVDSSAGLSQALTWAKDPSVTLREFAASVLVDIGGETAREALEKLALDSNPAVAIIAKSGFKSRERESDKKESD